MVLPDKINYTLFNNPVYTKTSEFLNVVVNGVVDFTRNKPEKLEYIKMNAQEPLWKLARNSGPWLQLAALSGAAGVVLGAYGSHKSYSSDKGLDQKRAFDSASRYHFIHTLSLLGLPMCKNPYIAGSFMLSGLVLFCGTCYYYAFTGDKTFSKLTPFGGSCFIAGWLGMII